MKKIQNYTQIVKIEVCFISRMGDRILMKLDI